MFDVIPFAEALKMSADQNRRHLLLGNGFSIACRSDIFNYQRLLEQADFTSAPSARGAFNKLDTSDFERVVRALRDFSNLASLYTVDGTQAFKDADVTREILIKTIQDKHPELPATVPDAEYLKCWEFLTNFSSLFTLNYDLLLYWTQMKRIGRGPMDFSDGFDRQAGALVWSEDNYNSNGTYFLHGALHLYEVDGDLQKYAWMGSEPPILVQVAEAIRKDQYPLFVCEGKAEEKMAAIKRSKYLMHCFNELGRLKDDLFIFGHSLRAEDKHILDQIKDSGVTRLFVGVRVADGPELVAEIQGRAVELAEKACIGDLNFFDAESAHVWR